LKRRSVLKRQTVKKKKQGRLSKVWKGIVLVGAYFLKASCLVVGLVVISLLFMSAYEYLLTSPFIRLESVIFTGVDKRIKRELIETSGLHSELSLLAINLIQLKETMEKHPWVRSVNLEKRFPHTLVVQAERETPRAIVVMDRLYYLNRWGDIFTAVDQQGAADYPVVTGVPEGGKERERHLKQAAQVLNVLESEKGPWSLEDLAEVHLKKNGEVFLYFSSFPAVVQARGEELGTRITDLKRVVEHLKRTGRIRMVKGINLNYHDSAVVSFKNG